jgi:hypothetical protein
MEDITTEPPAKGFDLFLKLLVIGLGIVLGLVAAFIISLLAGWIEFAC